MRRLVQEGLEKQNGSNFMTESSSLPQRMGACASDPEKPSYRIYGEGFTEEIRIADRFFSGKSQESAGRSDLSGLILF